MTQNSSPWDGIAVGDAANAPYSSNEWAHLWKLLGGGGSLFPNYGILQGTGDGTYDPLQVIASGGSNVDVSVGAALVNGKLYETDAAITLTVGANVSGNPRIDTAILRVDYTAQTVRAVILQGTPAGSPVAPTLTQNASVWEIPLANIAAANGFSSITRADITDRRRALRHSAAGWTPYAYPLLYFPELALSGALAMTTLAIPVFVPANMLVDSISFPSASTGNRTFLWGLYTQDLNDVAANDVVRSLGGRYISNSIAVTNGVIVNSVADAPFYVPPGTYWLIVQGMTGMSYQQPTSVIEAANTKYLFVGGASSPPAQTIDLGTGFSTDFNYIPIRVNGRVLGEATGFYLP